MNVSILSSLQLTILGRGCDILTRISRRFTEPYAARSMKAIASVWQHEIGLRPAMADISCYRQKAEKKQRNDKFSLAFSSLVAGRRVVVAGGSRSVAEETKCLIEAGALVELYAEYICADLQLLINASPDTSQLKWHNRNWALSDFDLATLAICDAASDREGEDFYSAAKTAGALVHVIDRPAMSDFRVDTLTGRRSLNVHTPGLVWQMERCLKYVWRISLDIFVSGAALAGRLLSLSRCKVTDQFGFWQRSGNNVYVVPKRNGSERKDLRPSKLARFSTQFKLRKGSVTLVGAGPGAAEHLTLKAVRALQEADVILHDDLIEPEVLALAHRDANAIGVGKRGGRRSSCRQSDINNMLVKLALEGKRVVRLKSGDPMIFGRAGEEIEALEKAGIEVAVVPGVTAAFGAAAQLGISLTHRDLAQSVRFITGHGKSGTLPETLDWQGLADQNTTLIVYMGGRTAGSLATRLIAAGLPPDTPVALIEAATKPQELRKSCTLSSLATDTHVPVGPLLIGIGRVFGLRQNALAAGAPDHEGTDEQPIHHEP